MNQKNDFKTILLMTDFSDHAQNACEYSIETFGSDVTYFLMNTYEIRGSAATLIDLEGLAYQDSIDNLTRKETFLRNKYGADLTLHIVSKNGAPVNVINKFIKVESVDLIVVGSKGISKLDEILIGSVTTAIIRGTKLPVLTIPLKAKSSKLQKIVLANDLTNITSDTTVIPLIKFKNRFNSFVTTVVVADSKNNDTAKNTELMEALSNADYSDKEILLADENISNAITKFCAEDNADLLVVVAKHTSFFKRFFHKSVTSELVNHEQLPILVLEEN